MGDDGWSGFGSGLSPVLRASVLADGAQRWRVMQPASMLASIPLEFEAATVGYETTNDLVDIRGLYNLDRLGVLRWGSVDNDVPGSIFGVRRDSAGSPAHGAGLGVRRGMRCAL